MPEEENVPRREGCQAVLGILERGGGGLVGFDFAGRARTTRRRFGQALTMMLTSRTLTGAVVDVVCGLFVENKRLHSQALIFVSESVCIIVPGV